jgi:hypothetical protein
LHRTRRQNYRRKGIQRIFGGKCRPVNKEKHRGQQKRGGTETTLFKLPQLQFLNPTGHKSVVHTLLSCGVRNQPINITRRVAGRDGQHLPRKYLLPRRKTGPGKKSPI